MVVVSSALSSSNSSVVAARQTSTAQMTSQPVTVSNCLSTSEGQLLKASLAIAQSRLKTTESSLEAHLSSLPYLDGQQLTVPSEEECGLTQEVVRARNEVKIAESMLSVHNERERLFVANL